MIRTLNDETKENKNSSGKAANWHHCQYAGLNTYQHFSCLYDLSSNIGDVDFPLLPPGIDLIWDSQTPEFIKSASLSYLTLFVLFIFSPLSAIKSLPLNRLYANANLRILIKLVSKFGIGHRFREENALTRCTLFFKWYLFYRTRMFRNLHQMSKNLN